jgi:hypothetical protein
MRRILLLLTMVAVMAAVIGASALPAGPQEEQGEGGIDVS